MAIQEIMALMPSDNITLNNDNLINVNKSDQASFSNLIEQSASEVNRTLVTANDNLHKLAKGEQISTHELMLSLEQAKYQLELSLEIRNKLVEGYQEVMRMQL